MSARHAPARCSRSRSRARGPPCARPRRSLPGLGLRSRLPIRLSGDRRPARRIDPAVPRGRRAGHAGDVYVADQLSYVVQKFNAAGTYLGEWGSYGGGHGQFGPIGGLATDAAGNVYVVDSAHNRIEKFDLRRRTS